MKCILLAIFAHEEGINIKDMWTHYQPFMAEYLEISLVYP